MPTNFTNQLDEATLANQYDAIRRSGGSGSAKSLREAFRSGGFGDETQKFQGSGVRRAGWQDSSVAPESMPEVDPESRGLLGGRLGEFTTEGGQSQYGYYGDVDVFDRGQLDPWLTESGFSYAKGPEDADYVKAGLDLPSLWKNPLFKTGQYDFTQKYGYNTGDVYNKGVNDYMASLGYTHDLGQNFDLQATTKLPGVEDTFTRVKDYYGKKTINDYLSSIGYQDYTDSDWRDYVNLVEDQNYAKTGGRDWWSGNVNNFNFANETDPNKLLSDMWNTLGGNEVSKYIATEEELAAGDNWFNPGPRYTNDSGVYRGKIYTTMAEAEAAKQANLQQALSNPAIRSEVLAQALTTGKLGGVFASDPTASYMVDSPWGPFAQQYVNNRGRFGGDEIANQLNAEQLRKILGSKDILYGGNTLGSIFNNPSDPYHDSWSDYSQSTKKNKFGTQKKTTTNWDYGDVGAGLSFNDPNWFANNALRTGDNQLFVAKDKLGSMTGAKAEDWYNREQGSNTQKSATGLGKLVGAALNFVPVVGPMASMAFNAMNSGQGPTLASMAGSMLGMSGAGGALGESLGLSGNAANAVGSGLIQGGLTAGQGLINGQSLGQALKSGAISGAGGALGGYAGGYMGNMAGEGLQDILGQTGSKIASDIVRGGVGSFVGNATKGVLGGKGITGDMAKAAGIGALTGGLGSAAGSALNTIFNPENDRAVSQNYNNIAKTIAQLGPSYYSGQQQRKVQNRQNAMKQAQLNQLVTKLNQRRQLQGA